MNRCPHLRTFHTFVRDGGEWAGNHPPYDALQKAGVRLIFFADDDPQIAGELGSALQAGFVVGGMAVGLATARFIGERKWRFE